MIFEIEVNNDKIKANKGETILEALNRNGIELPTLCHLSELFPTGACRICMVEVEGKDFLVPACSHPVEEWMKIYTHSPKVIHARKTIVELLLSNHPDDCLYCERNGNCELQDLAVELLIRQRRYSSKKNDIQLDTTSASIIRDQAKCIVCGRCVRVCEEIQGVSAIDFINKGTETLIGPAYNKGLNYSTCIDCGQCVVACPTGAFIEKNRYSELETALHDSSIHVSAQVSPTVSITLAEEFGIKSGKDITGIIIAALKKIGFDSVFNTSYGVDINVMEQANLMADRIEENKDSTVFSSCCPAWVKYVEQNNPGMLPNLVTVKSPQQILGVLTKEYFAQQENVTPEKILSVSIMPCTAKKYEAQKNCESKDGIKDVDLVMTTRELARLIRLHGIDMEHLEPVMADEPFNLHSSSARLYSVVGGVTEALIRTLYFKMEGKELPEARITAVRNVKECKEYTIKVKGKELNFAVVSGMKNAIDLFQKVIDGRKKYHFVEVMACAGGCVNGGGQPIGTDEKTMKSRIKGVYNLDEKVNIRYAHKNPKVVELYKNYLGEVGGEKSKELLHCEEYLNIEKEENDA